MSAEIAPAFEAAAFHADEGALRRRRDREAPGGRS